MKKKIENLDENELIDYLNTFTLDKNIILFLMKTFKEQECEKFSKFINITKNVILQLCKCHVCINYKFYCYYEEEIIDDDIYFMIRVLLDMFYPFNYKIYDYPKKVDNFFVYCKIKIIDKDLVDIINKSDRDLEGIYKLHIDIFNKYNV